LLIFAGLDIDSPQVVIALRHRHGVRQRKPSILNLNELHHSCPDIDRAESDNWLI
jgi:hypothetical protein